MKLNLLKVQHQVNRCVVSEVNPTTNGSRLWQIAQLALM